VLIASFSAVSASAAAICVNGGGAADCQLIVNVHEVNGMNPGITRTARGHQTGRIFNDGIDLSQLGYRPANIVGPVKTELMCIPSVLNDSSRGRIAVMLSMPAGVRRCDIDIDAPLVFYPGEVQARYFGIHQVHAGGRKQIYVAASFDKSDCIENLRAGFNNIDIAGQFVSGRYFYGRSQLYVVGHRCRRWRFAPVQR
jgi:hypothetical protein